jgi:hypothetical protein
MAQTETEQMTMRRTITVIAIVVMSGIVCYGQAHHQPGRNIVLPNANLLRCVSSDCSQLWEGDVPGGTDIYPNQLTIDLLDNKPCPLGIMARYDRSVALTDLKAALDHRYGKWADARNVTNPVKLWRVEPEKFAIQLSTVDKREARSAMQESATRTVIYMAFQPSRCDAK